MALIHARLPLERICSDAEKQSIAEKFHTYTGLPVSYLIRANLRVNGGEFEKSLAEDMGLTIGRLDTRFTGPSLNPMSENADYDPQSAAISSAYVSLFNSYIRKDLKYGDDQTYLPSADVFGGGNEMGLQAWREFQALNVSNDLADAMKTNPHFKVMLNGGYYDMATPFFAAQYEEKHLPIQPRSQRISSTPGTSRDTWSTSTKRASSSCTIA